MNEQRTFLRGGLPIGGPGASTAGGMSRHFLSLAATVLPRLGLCAVGVVGLVMILSPAGVCAAAESGNPADNAGSQAKSPGDNGQAAPAPAGIRDPLNPHQYMKELAGRLNPSSDKQLLLRGVPQDKATSQKDPAAQKPGNSRPAPSTPVVSAQVVSAGPNGRKAKTGDKDDAAPTRFMAFWDDPSLNSPPGRDLGTAAGAEASTNEERVIPTTTARNRQVQTVPGDSREVILGPLGVALDSMKPGVVLAAQESPANFAGNAPADGATSAKAGAAKGEKKRWSAGADLDKYRAHAVNEGSRGSGQNIKKAFERAGLTLEDGVNVFVLGYASPRGEAFRKNDGKGLLDEPGKVPAQAGATLGSAGLGLYSVADLILLNGLPDPNVTGYQDNHPVVRPLLFTGQMIGGVWKTTEEVGNAVTWGYFDNITGCIGMCIEDILELLKHTGEAVTNIARVPVQLVVGKNEGAQRAMDWVLLVPLEFVSNSVEMKGIANMQDYKTAFEDKGVMGSVIELGGSSFLVYRGTKELADKLDDKHHHKCRTTADSSSGNGVTPDTPPDPGTPPPLPPDQIFLLDGDWPVENLENGAGMVLIDGVWTTVKSWRE
jgi:hypothetical protein